jgi:hypothetical protein
MLKECDTSIFRVEKLCYAFSVWQMFLVVSHKGAAAIFKAEGQCSPETSVNIH